MTGESSYTGHAPSRHYMTSPNAYRPSSSNSLSSYNSPTSIAPPPQASIHPGPGVRRQSDYVEHHNQAYSGYIPPNRPIEYPQAHGLGHSNTPQPPPPTASHALERYDARPAVVRSGSIRGLDLVANQGDEVRYWNDVVLGLTGLKNFGA
jgi:ubiquitin carboxyl-terminal hydrolase 8